LSVAAPINHLGGRHVTSAPVGFAAGGLSCVSRRTQPVGAATSDPDVIRRRDVLLFATNMMQVVEPLLSLYVTVKKARHR
jgi:hypothetical protein